MTEVTAMIAITEGMAEVIVVIVMMIIILTVGTVLVAVARRIDISNAVIATEVVIAVTIEMIIIPLTNTVEVVMRSDIAKTKDGVAAVAVVVIVIVIVIVAKEESITRNNTALIETIEKIAHITLKVMMPLSTE